MKKHIIFFTIIILFAISPWYANADSTYNGISLSGTEGTDWEYYGDPEYGCFVIKKNDVSISGTATSDVEVLISNGVKRISFDGINKGEHSIYVGSDDSYKYNELTIDICGANLVDQIDIYEYNGSYIQAGTLVLKGLKSETDKLTVVNDISAGKGGAEIQNISLNIGAVENAMVDSGLYSEGDIEIHDSVIVMTDGIMSEGDISIKDSSLDLGQGIAAHLFTFNNATGEGAETYYDICVEDSVVKLKNTIAANNIDFIGDTKVDINISESEETESFAYEGIYAKGLVEFKLNSEGAYVHSVGMNGEKIKTWAINAEGGIICRSNNAIENGGTIVYLGENEEYIEQYTIEDKEGVIKSELKVLYSQDIEKPRMVVRAFGSTRYETSYAAADELKEHLQIEKFGTVVIASGDNFPDALVGSYLAARYDAPILLVDGTNSKSIEKLKEYLVNNLEDSGKVYLLGEKGVIPASVERSLSGYSVKRLGGKSRYETNIEILKEAGISTEKLLICTGNNFADSLSCSASELPVLLVDTTLTSEQKSFLDSFNGNEIYIIGGSGAVNDSIEKQLKSYGTVERIGGKDRFETSTLVAEKFRPASHHVIAAYAMNFPDGTCGGALAACLDAPLVLIDKGDTEFALEYIKKHNIISGHVLGGSGVISDSTVRSMFGMTNREAVVPIKYN